MHFARSLQPTGFLDSAVISTARQSCRLTPTELRTLRNTGTSETVKLPACHDMLTDIRSRLWTPQAWSGDGLAMRMTYLACMWGFDQSARISEYTVPEPRAQDHCIRLDDLSFYLDGIVGHVGSVLAKNLAGALDDPECSGMPGTRGQLQGEESC